MSTAKLPTQLDAAARRKLGEKLRRSRRAAPQSKDTEIIADLERRYDPFPLTELQQAYWIGRGSSFNMGNCAGHSYVEIDTDRDLQRLEVAWNQVVARHEMMRAIILPDGTQQILPEVPDYKIPCDDMRDATNTQVDMRLAQLRDEISHQILECAEFPLFRIHAVRLADRIRLFVGIDALVVDGWSLAVVFEDWDAFYRNPALLPALELSFRDYVLAVEKLESSDRYESSKAYWTERCPSLPAAPPLPTVADYDASQPTKFERFEFSLEAAAWAKLRRNAAAHDLTPTVIAITAYAYALSIWSGTRNFCINVPQFNRLPLHPDVNGIVGEAASFILLEVDLAADLSFVENARKIQYRLLDDLDNTYFSGVAVLREIARVQQITPIMPVVFTGAPQKSDGTDGFLTTVARHHGEVVHSINQTPQVWLDNHMTERDGEVFFYLDGVQGLFPPHLVQSFLDSFGYLMSSLINEPSWQKTWRQSAQSMQPKDQIERRRATHAYDQKYRGKLIHEAFGRFAALQPNAPAIIHNDRKLTYGEAEELIKQWAWKISTTSTWTDTSRQRLVAIVMDKGWQQPIGAMAALYAGAPYTAFDASQPQARINKLLEQARPQVVLTNSATIDRFEWPSYIAVLNVDDDSQSFDQIEPKSQSPTDLAYVIFTSGSTGDPKGVMLKHDGAVNCVEATLNAFDIKAKDVILGLTALHHDLSIFDIFGAFNSGAAFVIPTAGRHLDPAHWSDLINEHKVSVWNSVPAMMTMFLEYSEHIRQFPSYLRLTILGGDWVPTDTLTRMRKLRARTKLVTIGGPTETTVWNIWHEVEPEDSKKTSIPYGKPIVNAQYYILSEDMLECPDYVVGEMCCAGPCVMAGYWEDPELTDAKTCIHPESGESLFMTGDVGRYLHDGSIEFVGRKDFMIKVDGHRIESGEVESALTDATDVAAAVVVPKKIGSKVLLGAYVLSEVAIDTEALRNRVADKLPSYMVPSIIEQLERFPLTNNGKVDRKTLAGLALADSGTATSSQAADASTIGKIVDIVCNVLRLDDVDPNGNLVALGANSLDIVQISNRIDSEFNFRPRMDELFRLQSVAAIAAYCDAETGDGSSSDRDQLDGVYAHLIDRFEQLIDPEERDAVKAKKIAIRKDINGERTPLGEKLIVPSLRTSQRRFALTPIPLDALSILLSTLKYQLKGNELKSNQASPGGLYPIQTYLHVKPGRVEGLSAGTYYYHPTEHELQALHPHAVITRDIHVPFVNTPVFDEAAVSVFLVMDLRAIAPFYGQRSIPFGFIEAGVIAHSLELSAMEAGIGACQIGGVEFDEIRDLFDLEEEHIYLHSLLLGMPLPKSDELDTSTTTGDDAGSRLSSLLDRIERGGKPGNIDD